MGRQPGGCLKLPREVMHGEMSSRSHLLQGQAGIKVPLDVIKDDAELPVRELAIPSLGRLTGCQDVPDQVDGQHVGQRLGSQWSSRVA
jgi:hypothetical protein